jgi:hypothetical protein
MPVTAVRYALDPSLAVVVFGAGGGRGITRQVVLTRIDDGHGHEATAGR